MARAIPASGDHQGRPVVASRLAGCVQSDPLGVSSEPRGLTAGIPWCSLRREMSSSLVQRNKAVAKRKGTLVAVTVAGAGVAALASPVIGIIGLAGAAYLAWDWFSFRVKNGMRF
jgi:hypothetical protein